MCCCYNVFIKSQILETKMNILIAKEILKKYEIDLNRKRDAFIIKMADAINLLKKNNLSAVYPYFKRNDNGIVSIVYKCECGNIAESHVNNFAQKKVFACKKCNAGKINSLTKRISLDNIKSNLNDKGFKVINIENYNGSLCGSSWELSCKHNHIFKRSGNHIQNIKCCPFCFTESISETLIREMLEIHFNKKFPSVRPDFLKSQFSNKNLEIDMYNEDLKIGFEYNGIQHYEAIYGKERLLKSIKNDNEKMRLCEENGINLIVLKYVENESKNKRLFLEEIVEILKSYNIFISSNTLFKVINKEHYFTNNIKEKIEKILVKNNKKLITKKILDLKGKVDFKCLCCNEKNTVSISTVMKWKNENNTNCRKCCFSKKADKAELRHTTIANQYCNNNGFLMAELIRNKDGHVTGFKYRDENNEIKIFGSKKYKKYIKEISSNF